MINRIHRFHGHGSLKFTYRKGETVRGPLCSIKYTLNTRRETYRLSVVVNKKVNKSAVKRNRIRRVVYEVVRQLEDKIVQPYDIVVTIFSDQILDLEHKEIQTMISSQLKQARII
jgi:ribonuclease P protein component